MAIGRAPERQSSDAERTEPAPDAGEGPSVAAREGREGGAEVSAHEERSVQQGNSTGEPGHEDPEEGRGEGGQGGEGGREGGEEDDGEGRGGKEATGEEREAHTDELGEMPKTIVRRIVKAKLLSVLGKRAPVSGGVDAEGQQKDVNISKDALVAFAESAKIFVHYVTALAHDWSVQGKRQTITAEDVLRGLEDAQLFEFIPQLQETLETLRASKKSKKAKKSNAGPTKDSGLAADGAQAQDSLAGEEAPQDAPQP